MHTHFLNDAYLIGNAAGVRLYREIASLPILDPHNHADVAEIAGNRTYRDIWQAEAATDHYVWAALRSCGVPEQLITGNADPRDKWRAACSVWDDLAGNPTYEWVYLDLKRLLGINDHLCAETADNVWEQAAAVLSRPDMRPQSLLARMGVESMGSTDDPIDDLANHRALRDSDCRTRILPTFRPDRAMNIFRDDWNSYIDKLAEVAGRQIDGAADLAAALRIRHDYFAELGCRASDHGISTPFAYFIADDVADAIIRKRRQGQTVTANEVEAFMAWLLHTVAGLNAEKGWVFQLHLGVIRNVRDSLFATIGPDAGGDISTHHFPIVEPLRDLLNRYDGRLKAVLYCLDPGHQATLATLTRAFGQNIRLGSAWWFNDTPVGMKRQLEYISGVDLLSNYGGMVSDSRKLLSYASRHEMFRRVLADVVGDMVERGRIPEVAAVRLVQKMVYSGVKEFFGV